MTVPKEDRDRIRDDYTRGSDATTVEEIEQDLKDAGFEESLDSFRDAIGAEEDLVTDRQTLQRAQREAVDSLSDAGAVGGEIVRAEDGFTPIGKPQNVEQEVRRTGPTTGDVIARNTNTGTEGKIGEVDLVNPAGTVE